MRPYKRIGIITYASFDFIAAALSWALLFFFRKIFIESYTWDNLAGQLSDRFFLGVLLMPACWVVFYFLTGTYSDVYRKSRLAELYKTLLQSIAGVILLFFVLILDDVVSSYRDYYLTVTVLFSTHFILTVTGRMVTLTNAKRQLQKGKVSYNTLIIGGNENAIDLYHEITGQQKSMGYHFIGFIDINGNSKNGLRKYVTCLGKLSDLEAVLQEYAIDEVIIAIETSEHDRIKVILDALSEKRVVIKIIPDMYDILAGSVKMSNVLGAVLIEIQPDLMPKWQTALKRLLDVIVSGTLLILLSPIILITALRVRMSSKGPILYKQERIGKNGKPFTMYKFRSMYIDAERSGPMLSRKNDPRITGWGRVMRKWRLDEVPQFYNVLKGDMSLVGPRPERGYFIRQILDKAPAYKHLQKVKPGITSWGMVKYGYAENVDQMIKRMKYDLLYIENQSLAIDFKIMIYTALIILQGKGK